MKNTNKAGKYVGIGCAGVIGLIVLGMIVSMFIGIFTLKNRPAKTLENYQTISFSQEYTDISKLDLNYDVGELVIKAGDTLKVEGTDLPETFKATNEGGTLLVGSYMNSSSRDLFTAKGKDGKYPRLTLTLPPTLKFQDCALSLGAGETTLSDLNTNNLKLDMGAGTFTGNNITANKADFSSGAGKIDLTAMNLNDLNLDGGVGATNYEGKLTGNCHLTSGMGETNLELTGNVNDYAINAEDGVGGITVNNTSYDKATYNKAGAPNQLDIENGVGTFNIRFK